MMSGRALYLLAAGLACAAVLALAAPSAKAETPTPAPAGTPWPAPASLRMLNSYSDDFSVTHVDFSWAVLSGFTGVFEVQRAYAADRFHPREQDFLTVATVPATEALSGRAHYREDVELAQMLVSPPCYRVRAVIGTETGPYSAEPSCAILPPDAVRTAPRPPAVGNAPAVADYGATDDRLAVWGAVAAGTLGAACAWHAGKRLRGSASHSRRR